MGDVLALSHRNPTIFRFAHICTFIPTFDELIHSFHFFFSLLLIYSCKGTGEEFSFLFCPFPLLLDARLIVHFTRRVMSGAFFCCMISVWHCSIVCCGFI